MLDFNQYDRENPQIWDGFVAVALETKNKGFKNYSAKGIFEILRWQTGIAANDGCFKVNNNFTADYARKLETLYPMFQGFFRTRVLKTARAPRKIVS